MTRCENKKAFGEFFTLSEIDKHVNCTMVSFVYTIKNEQNPGLILTNELEKVMFPFFVDVVRKKLLINCFPKVRFDIVAP